MFDWDDMRVFLAVARARRLATAARQLGIDATTISRRLARLSAALGSDLFEPSGGERRLTAQGLSLLRHAESAESAALAALEEVTGQRRGVAGQVRLSVAEGFGTWVLARGMAQFNASHPDVRLDIITASGFLNPSKREADMAVMLARPQRGRLTVRRLGDYRLHLYGSASYFAERAMVTQRGDLHRHTLVGYVPEFIFAPELDYLGEVEPGLEAQLRSTSINVQHRLIAGGAGIGVLPDFIARHDPSLVKLLGEDVEITRSFWQVVHSDMQKLPRIEAVARWLKDRVEALVETA